MTFEESCYEESIYECPICGSKLICDVASWKVHFKTYPSSIAYCNGEMQMHIVNREQYRAYSHKDYGTHPLYEMHEMPENDC